MTIRRVRPVAGHCRRIGCLVMACLVMEGCTRTEALLPEEFVSHPLERTVADPQATSADDADLFRAEPFVFTSGIGNAPDGYDVLVIQGDGSAEYTFRLRDRSRESVWKRATFQVPDDDLDDLKALLRDIRYFELEQQYFARVVDGTQMFLKLQAGEVRKRVYCDNHFPDEMARVFGFVRRRVIDRHQEEIRHAPVVEVDWDEQRHAPFVSDEESNQPEHSP